MGTTAPSFFEPIFGKTAPERSEHGEGTAGRASGALPFGRLQRRHQPIRGLTRSLDVFDTAQTRLPLEGGDGS